MLRHSGTLAEIFKSPHEPAECARQREFNHRPAGHNLGHSPLNRAVALADRHAARAG